MTLYIVEALRHGDRELHSYVVGVFNNPHMAASAAVAHEYWRGGKYECFITKHKLNGYNEIEIENCKENCLDDAEFVNKAMVKMEDIKE